MDAATVGGVFRVDEKRSADEIGCQWHRSGQRSIGIDLEGWQWSKEEGQMGETFEVTQ